MLHAPPRIFERVRTLELDVELGGEPMTLRLELFKARHQAQLYRARLWRRELFRMTPSFPRDDDDQPTERTDDTLFVDWSDFLEDDLEELIASSDEQAEEKALGELRKALAAASWVV
ncbi:MAG: hypothetical protein VYE22_12180 [Myxococcota bacterium]|nr:hypothetical protein [Myxococcota bacterium]